MALAKDLTHLPAPAKPREDGCPPDNTPRFAHLLAEQWAAEDAAAGELPLAKEGARFRHSNAGGCSRAIAYAALGVPPSNPMDLSGVFTVRLGSMVHEAWQAVLQERYPGAEIEVKVGSGERAGHIDAVVTIPEAGEYLGDVPDTDALSGRAAFADRVVAIEGKTVGGYAYKQAIGERGTAQGPKHAHVIQAALNASEVNADEAVVVYWSKESVSVQAAARKKIDELTRFCAEWSFTRETYEPIAEAERARVAGILALLDEGTLPARKYPDPDLPKGAVIVDPTDGQWRLADSEGQVLDAGTWWACLYCRWQTVCAGTPAGRTPVAEVESLLGRPTLRVIEGGGQ